MILLYITIKIKLHGLFKKNATLIKMDAWGRFWLENVHVILSLIIVIFSIRCHELCTIHYTIFLALFLRFCNVTTVKV